MSRHPLTRRGPRAGIVVVAAAALVAALLPVADVRADTEAEVEPVSLVIGYEDGTSPAEKADIVAAAELAAPALETVSVPDDVVEVVVVPEEDRDPVTAALAEDPRVTYVEEPVPATLDVERIPSDPLWGDMATHRHTALPEAWSRTVGSADVTIAVIDNAFDVTHTDLRGALVAGWDVVSDTSNVSGDPACPSLSCRDRIDLPAHGTSTALLAGGIGDNGFGGAGACWRCRLMPIKITDADGGLDTLTMRQGIRRAVAAGVDIISMSVSTDGSPAHLLEAVTEAHDAGILIVASAGNEGPDEEAAGEQRWPAAYDDVLGVAGTDPSAEDVIDRRSSRGSWVSVAASYRHSLSARMGGQVYFSGTSSATPVVAGIAALLKSVEPSLDGAALRAVIEQTAVPLAGNAVAHGRVDAAAALEQVMGQAYTTAVLPLQPADVTAGTGFADGDIDVVWRQPLDGPAIDSFTVTATPGGQSVTVGPSARGATLSGLTIDVAHTVTIVAQNDAGGSSPGTSAPTYPGGSDETTVPPPPPGCVCEDPEPPEQPVPGGTRHPVYGDWDGDGVDTPGWFTGGRWYLRNDYESGGAQVVVAYGAQPADRPVVGDWDGDGRDGIGIKRGSEYHLRNVAGAGGRTDHQFSFGFAGDAAVAGDWDHDGRDTIALKRGGVWYLRDSSNPAVRTYTTTRLGAASDVAVAGDWDGDGRDTLGVFRNGTWYRLVRNDGGGSTRFHPLVSYGVSPGDRPLAGAYRVGGADALVIVRGSTWHLRHETSGTTWRQVAF